MTLVTIEPVLVLMVSIVFVPAWLSASRRGEAFWRFWRMTPRDRERQYLARLLSDRDAAKEIRAFSLGEFLRSRQRSLYDERISELRRVAARQLWHVLLANAVIAAAIAWLAAHAVYLHRGPPVHLLLTYPFRAVEVTTHSRRHADLPQVGVLVLSEYVEPAYAMRLLQEHPELTAAGARPPASRPRLR